MFSFQLPVNLLSLHHFFNSKNKNIRIFFVRTKAVWQRNCPDNPVSAFRRFGRSGVLEFGHQIPRVVKRFSPPGMTGKQQGGLIKQPERLLELAPGRDPAPEAGLGHSHFTHPPEVFSLNICFFLETSLRGINRML